MFTFVKRRRSNKAAIVIGLGAFGRKVLDALSLAGQTRPGLQALQTIWVGLTGWQVGDAPCASQDSTDFDSESWWADHEQAGSALMLAAITQAMEAAGSDDLDLYLVGHLHEAVTRELWQRVLDSARNAYAPEADLIFTLILATDSLTLRQLAPDEARSFQEALDNLAAELINAADGQEPSGRVGWCYLLDTLDAHARPLRGIDQATDREGLGRRQGNRVNGTGCRSLTASPTHHIIQSHVAAELIALLCAGLRKIQAYNQTSLAQVQREFLDRDPVARVSAFGAGSLVLPVPAIAQEARDVLARRLLVEYILGEDRPSDLPAARQLRSHWLNTCTLDPAGLRFRIMRDHGGNPLTFPVEPPQVTEVPDERLVDHPLNWDTLLWNRWRAPGSLAANMAANAEALELEAADWLESQLNDLLQHETGGHRVAALFLGEAREAIEDERYKDDEPARKEIHWLSALLSRLRLSRREQTTFPDLTNSRRRLEAALHKRLIPRAVWTRASLIGVTMLSFAWVPYLVAGEGLGLQGLVSRWFNLDIASNSQLIALDLTALALACLSLAFLAAFLQITMSELAIHRATERMMADIRRKYQALRERALLDERERIYASLLATLTRWEAIAKARRQILEESLAQLDSALREKIDPAPLLTEHNILPQSDWPPLMPHYDAGDERLLAEQFLNQSDRPAWDEETAGDLATDLRAFVEDELSGWREGLNLATWSAKPGNPGPMARLLERLRLSLQPAWPLSREDRTPVITRPDREKTPLPYEDVTRPLLVSNFVGLPGGEVDLPDQKASGEEIFTIDESGRLAFVPTVHALELEDLRICRQIRALAAVEIVPVEEATADGERQTAETSSSTGNLTDELVIHPAVPATDDHSPVASDYSLEETQSC